VSFSTPPRISTTRGTSSSMMAGAKYGLFDLDWLIHSLRVAEITVEGVRQQHLCFDSPKSMRLIESYILARESMYSQVYFHKTTRSFEALLSNIFGLACRITGGDPAMAPRFSPPILAKALAGVQLKLEEYLKLDDSRIWAAFQDWGTGPCRGAMMGELARKCRVLTERQRPYGVVNLVSDRNEKAIKLLAEFETEGAWRSEFACLRDRFRDEPYKNVFYRKKASDDEEKEYSPIYVLDADGRPQEAEQDSRIVRAISETQMEILRLHYDRENGRLTDRLRKSGLTS